MKIRNNTVITILKKFIQKKYFKTNGKGYAKNKGHQVRCFREEVPFINESNLDRTFHL